MGQDLENTPNEKSRLKVYYDGRCALCHRIVRGHSYLKGSDQIEYIDIHKRKFLPKTSTPEGPSAHELLQRIHVQTPRGDWPKGADAVRAIWEEFAPHYSRYQWYLKASEGRVGKKVLSGLLFLLNIFRYILPRRLRCNCPDDLNA